jgi:L-lysine exporter family protein LysE/ArgO
MSDGLFAAAVEGFAVGASLIIAIGAQNAFVLRQGLDRRHVFAVATVCTVSDALLIAAGVAGLGALVHAAPGVLTAVTLAGAAFLAAYGALALRRAFAAERLRPDSAASAGLMATVAMCLALTWLNPHVYLDTVILLGSISTRFAGHQAAFAAGAATGSFLFFFTLGYGAAWLRPIFARPAAWRILETVIAFVMWLIAFRLLKGM